MAFPCWPHYVYFITVPPISTHAPLEQVKPALDAIRALGPVLEDHLQLLLPALNRLIAPGSSGLPLAVQVREPSGNACVCPCWSLPVAHASACKCSGGFQVFIHPACPPVASCVQEETLSAMQDLLPRMQLAGFSSTVLHPLIRLLDG